jgi:hypothetical protein
MKGKLCVVLVFCALSSSSIAYKRTGHGHIDISQSAIDAKADLHGSEACWANSLFKNSIRSFRQQSAAEDNTSPGSGWWQLWRPLFHFYDPATHGGLLPWGNAVTRMKGMQEDADKALKEMTCALKNGDSGAAAASF